MLHPIKPGQIYTFDIGLFSPVLSGQLTLEHFVPNSLNILTTKHFTGATASFTDIHALSEIYNWVSDGQLKLVNFVTKKEEVKGECKCPSYQLFWYGHSNLCPYYKK
jgi:hypothetical protein